MKKKNEFDPDPYAFRRDERSERIATRINVVLAILFVLFVVYSLLRISFKILN